MSPRPRAAIFNPYAREPLVGMNLRVYESQRDRLAALTAELEQAGYQAGQVGQASLVRMLLHELLEDDLDAVMGRLAKWSSVTSAPAARVQS